VTCAAAVLLVVPKKAEAAFPGANGRIVYSASECCTGHNESLPAQIFTIKPDGSGLKQLTHTPQPAYNSFPSFSPDGKKIAWTKYEIGAANLWVMNSDGTNKQRLTSGPAEDVEPTFSPNGRWVGFARRGDMFMKSLDGGGLRQLTNTQDYLEGPPNFRPGGGRIAFTRIGFTPGCGCATSSELATMHRDGTDVRVVTDLSPHVVEPGEPDWSPDGRTLVYGVTDYNYEPSVTHIETINPDGTGRRIVFDPPPQVNGAPVFSPDGTKIAFGWGEIWTVNTDGSGLSNVTNTPNFGKSWPSWQPKLAPTG
jgi:TolB protein